MGAARETVVVRCTVKREKHARLYEAISEVRASERSERLRNYAAIGLALATNQPVIELLRIAIGEMGMQTRDHASDAHDARGKEQPGRVVDRPTEAYLDDLAEQVLSRA